MNEIDCNANNKIQALFNDYLLHHPNTLVVAIGLKKIPNNKKRASELFGIFIRQLQKAIDRQLESEWSVCGCPVRAMACITLNQDGSERLQVALMFDLNAFRRTSKEEVTANITNWVLSSWAKTLYMSMSLIRHLILLPENNNFKGLIAGRPNYKDNVKHILERLRILAKPVKTSSGTYRATFLYRNGRAEWRGIMPLSCFHRKDRGFRNRYDR